VLFMLGASGAIGSVLIHNMYQRALVEREHALAAEQEALMQHKIAEEQLEAARVQELKAQQAAVNALREAERRREKP
jgi:putative NADH-flavin reductase